MKLNQLLTLIEQQPIERLCEYGFDYPHSYRGYYNHVSFAPKQNVTIGEMLKFVKAAYAHEFTGWKGGENRYNDDTPVHFADEGMCNDNEKPIPKLMLMSILGID